MSKADRILSYFPAFYRAGERARLLYRAVAALAEPLEEADALLFRIQRAHRLLVAEQPRDIVRLAAALNLGPFHFEDLLADAALSPEERLARMRERVARVARVHLVGLGTPWAVLEAAAIFLDATMVPAAPGGPPIRHLDAAGLSHTAAVEFGHLPGRPRERLELHENPLVRRRSDPAPRWPHDSWEVANRSIAPAPATVSIQGVAERTVLPTVFCQETGEGLLFNGVVPAGATLRIGADGARLDGVPVDDWVITFSGGVYDFAGVDGAPFTTEQGRQGEPFAGDLEAALGRYQGRRPPPAAPVGAGRWSFGVAQGRYDGSLHDYAVYATPVEPAGVYDGDYSFDSCVFTTEPSGVVGMAWDERLLCAFKLLLPAHVPRPPAQAGGAEPTYVDRIGSIVARFRAAGVRAYVDHARDAWVLGEGVLRSGAAADGEGVELHTTRLRDPRGDLYVDAEREA